MSTRFIVSAAASFAALCFGVVTAAQADGHGRNNWTGFYAGIHGGGAWGDVDADGPGILTTTRGVFNGTANASVDVDGGIYGGHIGYNHQFGNIVAGGEVSYTHGAVKGSVLPLGTNHLNDENTSFEVNSLFQAVFRLGYAFDKALVYGKIGYANARVEIDSIDTDGSPNTFAGDQRQGGLVLGAGLDYEIFKNVLIGIDYSYINLKSEQHVMDFFNVDFGRVVGDVALSDVDPDIHAVTARLTYRFGGRSHYTSLK